MKLKGVKKNRLGTILAAAGSAKLSNEICYVKKRMDFICRDLGGPL